MNILMLRHSAGFEHSYLPDAEVTIKQLAKLWHQDWFQDHIEGCLKWAGGLED